MTDEQNSAARQELQRQCDRLSRELADAKAELAKRTSMEGILAEIRERRIGYRTTWGAPAEENYPDFDANDADYLPDAETCEKHYDGAQSEDRVTWMHFVVYEFAIVVSRLRNGLDEKTVRSQVLNVAVQCLAWIEAIDRRGATK